MDVCGFVATTRRATSYARPETLQFVNCPFETCTVAHDAYILPHKVLDFPHKFFHACIHGTVGISSARLGLDHDRWAAKFIAHLASSPASEPQSFEQGVASQTIGAVYSGCGRFSGGVQPW